MWSTMKKLAVVTVILTLFVAQFAIGQDGEFPSCTTEDLKTLLEIKSGFDAVWRQAFRTRDTDSLHDLTEASTSGGGD